MEGSVYLRAQQPDGTRYAALDLGKRNWQIADGGLLVLSLILAVCRCALIAVTPAG